MAGVALVGNYKFLPKQQKLSNTKTLKVGCILDTRWTGREPDRLVPQPIMLNLKAPGNYSKLIVVVSCHLTTPPPFWCQVFYISVKYFLLQWISVKYFNIIIHSSLLVDV